MDSLLVRLAETGVVGIGLLALWLAYKVASNYLTKPKISLGNPIPWDDPDDTGVRSIPPEKRPVIAGVCSIRHKAISQKMTALGDGIDKMDKKIDTLSDNVGEIRSSIAVLKDRSKRP